MEELCYRKLHIDLSPSASLVSTHRKSLSSEWSGACVCALFECVCVCVCVCVCERERERESERERERERV